MEVVGELIVEEPGANPQAVVQDDSVVVVDDLGLVAELDRFAPAARHMEINPPTFSDREAAINSPPTDR